MNLCFDKHTAKKKTPGAKHSIIVSVYRLVLCYKNQFALKIIKKDGRCICGDALSSWTASWCSECNYSIMFFFSLLNWIIDFFFISILKHIYCMIIQLFQMVYEWIYCYTYTAIGLFLFKLWYRMQKSKQSCSSNLLFNFSIEFLRLLKCQRNPLHVMYLISKRESYEQ